MKIKYMINCCINIFNIFNIFNIYCFLSLYSVTANSWDVIGHRVVAELASRHLTPEAKQEVQKILEGKEMAEVSTWADEIRSDEKWANIVGPWHYVNFDKDASYDKSKIKDKDKDNVEYKGDIIEAISRYYDQLKLKSRNKDRDKDKDKDKDKEALMFLIHLVGDIHQPLHVGYSQDKGGNDLKVWWFDKESNFHKVWDQDMIDSKKLSYTELTHFLDFISEDEKLKWNNLDHQLNNQTMIDSIIEWANESRSYLNSIYNIKKKNEKGEGVLGYEYLYENYPIVQLRLRQAGYRLSLLLNRIFEKPRKDIKLKSRKL